MPGSISFSSLGESELIGRGVFSGKQASKARRGRVIPEVFLERDGVDRISVNRLSYAPLSVLTQIGNEVAKNRTNGTRSFYGWAVLIVEDAEDSDRKVEPTPIEDNPYHADICLMNLPSDDTLHTVQYRHALDLATKSTWREKEVEPNS